MTIIQVVQHLSPGGIEVMAMELKKHLKNVHNDRVLIVSLEGDKKELVSKWPTLKNITDDIIFMNKRQGLSILLVFKLMLLFIKHNASVIHTHHIGPLIYAGLAARLSGILTLIHTEHDAWHLKNKKRRRIQKLMILLVRPKLVADADAVAKELKKYMGDINVNVIKNGIDTDYFSIGCKTNARIVNGLPNNTFLIGSSGRLEKVKGHEFLLRAVATLDDNVHVALAGDGSLKEPLKILAKSLGIEHRVHFLGHVENMPVFYQALDVFCLPSLNEGMPLAPLEAQACGIPAVVSNVGATGETLYREHSALVAPGDSEDLASALKILLIKKSESSPREFVKENANVVSMAKHYSCFYRNQGVYKGEIG